MWSISRGRPSDTLHFTAMSKISEAFSPIFEPFLTPFLISNSSNTHPKHHHISSVPASRCVELGLALNLGRSSLSSTLRRAPCAVLPQ